MCRRDDVVEIGGAAVFGLQPAAAPGFEPPEPVPTKEEQWRAWSDMEQPDRADTVAYEYWLFGPNGATEEELIAYRSGDLWRLLEDRLAAQANLTPTAEPEAVEESRTGRIEDPAYIFTGHEPAENSWEVVGSDGETRRINWPGDLPAFVTTVAAAHMWLRGLGRTPAQFKKTQLYRCSVREMRWLSHV